MAGEGDILLSIVLGVFSALDKGELGLRLILLLSLIENILLRIFRR